MTLIYYLYIIFYISITVHLLSFLKNVKLGRLFKDLVSKTEVEIVKNSCYAEAVGARPIGAVAEEAEDVKVVQTISQFMYED